MPLSKYDRHFSGRPGSAKKAYESMIARYGEEKGKRVFYATMESRRGKRERGTGLRKAVADRKKKRGRFKAKPKPPGLRGAMAARKR